MILNWDQGSSGISEQTDPSRAEQSRTEQNRTDRSDRTDSPYLSVLFILVTDMDVSVVNWPPKQGAPSPSRPGLASSPANWVCTLTSTRCWLVVNVFILTLVHFT